MPRVVVCRQAGRGRGRQCGSAGGGMAPGPGVPGCSAGQALLHAQKGTALTALFNGPQHARLRRVAAAAAALPHEPSGRRGRNRQASEELCMQPAAAVAWHHRPISGSRLQALTGCSGNRRGPAARPASSRAWLSGPAAGGQAGGRAGACRQQQAGERSRHAWRGSATQARWTNGQACPLAASGTVTALCPVLPPCMHSI